METWLKDLLPKKIIVSINKDCDTGEMFTMLDMVKNSTNTLNALSNKVIPKSALLTEREIEQAILGIPYIKVAMSKTIKAIYQAQQQKLKKYL